MAKNDVNKRHLEYELYQDQKKADRMNISQTEYPVNIVSRLLDGTPEEKTAEGEMSKSAQLTSEIC